MVLTSNSNASRESRHLAVYGLPNSLNTERINTFFSGFGRVQKVERRAEDDCVFVSFMDSRSATKAFNGENRLDANTPFRITFYEPDAKTGMVSSSVPTPLTTIPTNSAATSSVRLKSSSPKPRESVEKSPSAASSSTHSHSHTQPRPTSKRIPRETPRATKINEIGASEASTSSGPTSGLASSTHSAPSSSAVPTTPAAALASPAPATASTSSSSNSVAGPLQGIVVERLPLRSDATIKEQVREHLKKFGRNLNSEVIVEPDGDTHKRAVVWFQRVDVDKVNAEQNITILGQRTRLRVLPFSSATPVGLSSSSQDQHAKFASSSSASATSFASVSVSGSTKRSEEVDVFHPKASRTLYVGGLETRVTEESLRHRFSKFGEILDVDIKNGDSPSPFAFLQFADIDSSVRAINANLNGNKKGRPNFGRSMSTNKLWIGNLPEKASSDYITQKLKTLSDSIVDLLVDLRERQAIVIFTTPEASTQAYNRIRANTPKPFHFKLQDGNHPVAADYCSDRLQDFFVDRKHQSSSATAPPPLASTTFPTSAPSCNVVSEPSTSASLAPFFALSEENSSSSLILEPPPAPPPIMPAFNVGSSSSRYRRSRSPGSSRRRNDRSPSRDRERSRSRDREKPRHYMQSNSSSSRSRFGRDDQRRDRRKKRSYPPSSSSSSDSGSRSSSSSSSSRSSSENRTRSPVRRRSKSRRNSRSRSRSKRDRKDSRESSSVRNTNGKHREKHEATDDQVPSTSTQADTMFRQQQQQQQHHHQSQSHHGAKSSPRGAHHQNSHRFMSGEGPLAPPPAPPHIDRQILSPTKPDRHHQQHRPIDRELLSPKTSNKIHLTPMQKISPQAPRHSVDGGSMHNYHHQQHQQHQHQQQSHHQNPHFSHDQNRTPGSIRNHHQSMSALGKRSSGESQGAHVSTPSTPSSRHPPPLSLLHWPVMDVVQKDEETRPEVNPSFRLPHKLVDPRRQQQYPSKPPVVELLLYPFRASQHWKAVVEKPETNSGSTAHSSSLFNSGDNRRRSGESLSQSLSQRRERQESTSHLYQANHRGAERSNELRNGRENLSRKQSSTYDDEQPTGSRSMNSDDDTLSDHDYTKYSPPPPSSLDTLVSMPKSLEFSQMSMKFDKFQERHMQNIVVSHDARSVGGSSHHDEDVASDSPGVFGTPKRIEDKGGEEDDIETRLKNLNKQRSWHEPMSAGLQKPRQSFEETMKQKLSTSSSTDAHSHSPADFFHRTASVSSIPPVHPTVSGHPPPPHLPQQHQHQQLSVSIPPPLSNHQQPPLSTGYKPAPHTPKTAGLPNPIPSPIASTSRHGSMSGTRPGSIQNHGQNRHSTIGVIFPPNVSVPPPNVSVPPPSMFNPNEILQSPIISAPPQPPVHLPPVPQKSHPIPVIGATNPMVRDVDVSLHMATTALKSPPHFNSSIPPPIVLPVNHSIPPPTTLTPTAANALYKSAMNDQTPRSHTQPKQMHRPPEKIVARHDSMSKPGPSTTTSNLSLLNRSQSVSDPKRSQPPTPSTTKDVGSALVNQIMGTAPSTPSILGKDFKKLPRIEKKSNSSVPPTPSTPSTSSVQNGPFASSHSKDKTKEKEKDKEKLREKEKSKKEKEEKKSRKEEKQKKKESGTVETKEERAKRKALKEKMKAKEEKRMRKQMEKEKEKEKLEKEKKKKTKKKKESSSDDSSEDSDMEEMDPKKKELLKQERNDHKLAMLLAQTNSSISEVVKQRRGRGDPKKLEIQEAIRQKKEKGPRRILIESSDDSDKEKKRRETESEMNLDDSDEEKKVPEKIKKKKNKKNKQVEERKSSDSGSSSEDEEQTVKKKKKKKHQEVASSSKKENNAGSGSEEEITSKKAKKEKEKEKEKMEKMLKRKRVSNAGSSDDNVITQRGRPKKVKMDEKKEQEQEVESYEKMVKEKKSKEMKETEEMKMKLKMKEEKKKEKEEKKRMKEQNKLEKQIQKRQRLESSNDEFSPPAKREVKEDSPLTASDASAPKKLVTDFSNMAAQEEMAKKEKRGSSVEEERENIKSLAQKEPIRSPISVATSFARQILSPEHILSPKEKRGSIGAESVEDIGVGVPPPMQSPRQRYRTMSSASSSTTSSQLAKNEINEQRARITPLMSPVAKSSVSSIDEQMSIKSQDDEKSRSSPPLNSPCPSNSSQSQSQRPKLLTKAAVKSFDSTQQTVVQYPTSSFPGASSDSSSDSGSSSDSSTDDEDVTMIEREVCKVSTPVAEPAQDEVKNVEKEEVRDRTASVSSVASSTVSRKIREEEEEKEEVLGLEQKKKVEEPEAEAVLENHEQSMNTLPEKEPELSKSTTESKIEAETEVPEEPEVILVEVAEKAPISEEQTSTSLESKPDEEDDVSQPPMSLISEQETADAVLSIFDEDDIEPQYPSHDFIDEPQETSEAVKSIEDDDTSSEMHVAGSPLISPVKAALPEEAKTNEKEKGEGEISQIPDEQILEEMYCEEPVIEDDDDVQPSSVNPESLEGEDEDNSKDNTPCQAIPHSTECVLPKEDEEKNEAPEAESAAPEPEDEPFVSLNERNEEESMEPRPASVVLAPIPPSNPMIAFAQEQEQKQKEMEEAMKKQKEMEEAMKKQKEQAEEAQRILEEAKREQVSVVVENVASNTPPMKPSTPLSQHSSKAPSPAVQSVPSPIAHLPNRVPSNPSPVVASPLAIHSPVVPVSVIAQASPISTQQVSAPTPVVAAPVATHPQIIRPQPHIVTQHQIPIGFNQTPSNLIQRTMGYQMPSTSTPNPILPSIQLSTPSPHPTQAQALEAISTIQQMANRQQPQIFSPAVIANNVRPPVVPQQNSPAQNMQYPYQNIINHFFPNQPAALQEADGNILQERVKAMAKEEEKRRLQAAQRQNQLFLRAQHREQQSQNIPVTTQQIWNFMNVMNPNYIAQITQASQQMRNSEAHQHLQQQQQQHQQHIQQLQQQQQQQQQQIQKQNGERSGQNGGGEEQQRRGAVEESNGSDVNIAAVVEMVARSGAPTPADLSTPATPATPVTPAIVADSPTITVQDIIAKRAGLCRAQYPERFANFNEVSSFFEFF